jgi:hypothetical protein
MPDEPATSLDPNRKAVLQMMAKAEIQYTLTTRSFHTHAARDEILRLHLGRHTAHNGFGRMTERHIAVVGPSGVGTDRVMQSLIARSHLMGRGGSSQAARMQAMNPSAVSAMRSLRGSRQGAYLP